MGSHLYLSNSPGIRYASGALLYFAQGIPQGLLGIAMPAWLASQGLGPGAIASYLAIIILPWAFKLVTGPLMDRFEFRPMGNRRPWVLGAQLGMVVSLYCLTIIEDPLQQIGLLTMIGLLINSFTATQDVAVDGMAIDLVPESEHGRINAFMSCGKAVGWAATAAISGIMLVKFGLAATAQVAAAVAGLVFLLFLFVREREGERLLPWSAGATSAGEHSIPSFQSVFQKLNQVLWSRASIVIFIIMFLDGLVGGYGHALMPIAAVKLFGFSTEQWSQLVASMGLVGAFIALGLGPIIDRFGAKRMFFVTIVLVSLHAFLLAGTQQLWTDSNYVLAMLAAWVLMNPVTMVCAIAIAMSICSRGISATQFAIYMSTANLGSSVGSKLYGTVAEVTSYSQNYLLMGTLLLLLAIVITVFRKQDLSRFAIQEEG